MRRFLESLLVFAALFSPIWTQDRLSRGAYYRDNNSKNIVGIQCRNEDIFNSGPVTWGRNTRVTFYDENNEVLFDSASRDRFQFIESTRENNTIYLRDNEGKGWRNMACRLNNGRKGSAITIPFFYGPRFRYSPREFKLNKNFTLWCNGGASPNGTIRRTFWFNDIPIASLMNRQLLLVNNLRGLTVAPNFASPDDSITILPTTEQNRGYYGCNITYVGSNTDISVSSERVHSSDWAKIFNGVLSLFAGNLLFLTIASVLALSITAQ